MEELNESIKEILTQLRINLAQGRARDKNVNDLLIAIILAADIDVEKLQRLYETMRADETGEPIEMQASVLTKETIALIQKLKRLHD